MFCVKLFKRVLPKFRPHAAAISSNNVSVHQVSSASHSRTLSTYTFYHDEPPAQLNKILSKVDELQEQIDLAQGTTDNDLQAAIQHKLKLYWTYHSNAIEGNALTLEDTIFFLEHGLTVGGKPLKDFLATKNHAEVLDYLYEVVIHQRKINPYRMKEINALLLSGVRSTPVIDPTGNPTTKLVTPGEYKRWPNHVIQLDSTIHEYVEPLQVASEMDNLFAWINSMFDSKHPVIISSIAHYNLLRIHPFDDGNGRGARILMNLLLMKKHYPPAILKIENREQYIGSLSKADKGDIAPFLDIVSNALLETQEMILSEIKKNETENKNNPTTN